MFRNYIKTAYCKLKKNKLHSCVNIAGLAISVLFLYYVWFVLSFDRFQGWIFTIVGLFVILLASNYITWSKAIFSARSREIDDNGFGSRSVLFANLH